MEYPDERLTATSRYSYAEICATLDQWREVEARFDVALNTLPEDVVLPAQLEEELTWLEPISCPMDGIWHRGGSAERYPVAKWKKLLKKRERLISHIRCLTSVPPDVSMSPL